LQLSQLERKQAEKATSAESFTHVKGIKRGEKWNTRKRDESKKEHSKVARRRTNCGATKTRENTV
jgi:hypothetical protein